MSLTYHQRLGVLLVLTACAVLALVGQLFRLQVLEGEEWDAVALKLVTRDVIVRGHRGTIRDAEGYALAPQREWPVRQPDSIAHRCTLTNYLRQSIKHTLCAIRLICAIPPRRIETEKDLRILNCLLAV